MLKNIGGTPLIVKTFTNLINFKLFDEVAVITDSLKRFSTTTQTINEKNEKIEAIRIVENNFRFKMIQVYDETISIDTPSDLENANKYFVND